MKLGMTASQRAFWQVAGGYYRGRGAWRAWGLVLALTALTVAQVALAWRINAFQRTLFDALEWRDFVTVREQAVVFAVLLVLIVLVTALHLVVKRHWQLRWREHITEQLLAHWLERGHHHRLRHLPDAADNPDARISEDVRIATEVSIELMHSLLYSLLSIVVFAEVLWHLTVNGAGFGLPGLMVWLAIGYASVGTLLGWLLSRPLTHATHALQSREADFRFTLARARDKSEAVALAGGETFERASAAARFRAVAHSWWQQTRAYAGLVSFSTGYGTLLPVFPLLVLAWPYIQGMITLGLMMQAAQAFERLTAALSWPVGNMGEIARCRASIERIGALWLNLTALDERDAMCPLDAPCVQEDEAASGLTVHHLTLATPRGATFLHDFSATAPPGGITLWGVPPSAAAPLMKALAGLWSWGHGHITYPRGARLAFLPLRPYLPEGTLAAALAYPHREEVFSLSPLQEALTAVGASELIPRLTESEDWNRTLTPEQQRRVALARLLLDPPSWVILEATSAHDPVVTLALTLLPARLPQTAVVVLRPDAAAVPFPLGESRAAKAQ